MVGQEPTGGQDWRRGDTPLHPYTTQVSSIPTPVCMSGDKWMENIRWVGWLAGRMAQLQTRPILNLDRTGTSVEGQPAKVPLLVEVPRPGVSPGLCSEVAKKKVPGSGQKRTVFRTIASHSLFPSFSQITPAHELP